MLLAATPRCRLFALLATCVAASVALALVSGCALGSSAATARPTATRSAPPTPSALGTLPPTVTGTLGPPPSNCRVSRPPHTMTVTDFGGGFSGTSTFAGASPAWELGIGNNSTIVVTGNPYPSTKIMWVVGPNYSQPVTLSGHEVTTNTPLWFDVYPSNSSVGDSDHYGTSAILDPNAPNRGSSDNQTGHWNIWGIGIIALAAGCYQLDVASPGGSWQAVLAVGHGT